MNALYNGGIRCVEITLNTPHSLEMIEELKNHYENDLLIGAGTVLDQASAYSAIYAGADFILSPVLSYDVIEMCHRYSKCVVPGIATPTEAVNAWKEGADIVKIFPAAYLGSSYIKNILSPLESLDMMAVGGVTLENLSSFLRAGASTLGIGGSLADPACIAQEDYQRIEQLAKNFIIASKQ